MNTYNHMCIYIYTYSRFSFAVLPFLGDYCTQKSFRLMGRRRSGSRARVSWTRDCRGPTGALYNGNDAGVHGIWMVYKEKPRMNDLGVPLHFSEIYIDCIFMVCFMRYFSNMIYGEKYGGFTN